MSALDECPALSEAKPGDDPFKLAGEARSAYKHCKFLNQLKLECLQGGKVE